MSDAKKKSQGSQSDALGEGITDLVDAALGVGVALSRTIADATAGGRETAPPESKQGPLGDLVHYGITIVRNVFGLVFSVVDIGDDILARKPAQTTGKEAAPGAHAGPRVRRGDLLRIPLTVSNPAAEAMQALEFRCVKIRAQQLGAGKPVDGNAFRFEPAKLDIAPKDFEKLTLFIDTQDDTAPAIYTAELGVGDGAIELKVEFEVYAA